MPFYRAYVSYLSKLPSMSEVYLRAKEAKEDKLSCECLLEDLYRLINQVNLLTDNLNGTFNNVGRYYKDKIKVYRPMFRVLWA
jgi:hypothetical protein